MLLHRVLVAVGLGPMLSPPRQRRLQGEQTTDRAELRQCVRGASVRGWMAACIAPGVWLTPTEVFEAFRAAIAEGEQLVAFTTS
jgi:hypothetical protein